MHLSGSWILILFLLAISALILLVLHLTKLGLLIHQNIPDRPHRRLFLASISFFITFLAVRLLVASITHHVGPFGYVEMGGRHIHHLVWGILLLLITGYGTLAEVGTGDSSLSILASRLLALGFGIGAALTLDEFALWLNLDAAAYWSRQGRESVDAVVLFGAFDRDMGGAFVSQAAYPPPNAWIEKLGAPTSHTGSRSLVAEFADVDGIGREGHGFEVHGAPASVGAE
jgi:hypothetical protein